MMDDDKSIEETQGDEYIYEKTQDLVELSQEYNEHNDIGTPLDDGTKDVEVKDKDDELQYGIDHSEEFKDNLKDEIIDDWSFKDLLE